MQRLVDQSTRAATLVSVFAEAFGEERAEQPEAFARKFRKMAASPYAFYRGSACLFYHDVAGAGDGAASEFLDERTSRIWVHGDLHAANFGTYMDSLGQLVFNVNDFDEAYVGPFTWDLLRFSASLALIGHSKALDDATIEHLVTVFADGYRERMERIAVDGHESGALTLGSAGGVLGQVLRRSRLLTRIDLLDVVTVIEDHDRRFTRGGAVRGLPEAERAAVEEAFAAYVATVPDPAAPQSWRVKDVVARLGVGIGSAGLPSYNLLLEGRTQALENDVVLFMKQGQRPMIRDHVDTAGVADYFRHEGHRTALSQRALQDNPDPWLGWTELAGRGMVVAEVSPYATDLDWDDINEAGELADVVAQLAASVAVMHTVADHESSDSLLGFCAGDAIADALGGREQDFVQLLTGFAARYAASTRQDHQLFVDLFRNGEL